MHFWPGVVSSSLMTLIPSTKRISPLLSSSALTFAMSRFSKIVAAERRMVFRKNDLSNSCILRLIGGRKISGRFGEFIFCKFLDQTANLLVHRAIQTQEEILRISRKCALKRPPAANKIDYEPYAGSQIEIGKSSVHVPTRSSASGSRCLSILPMTLKIVRRSCETVSPSGRKRCQSGRSMVSSPRPLQRRFDSTRKRRHSRRRKPLCGCKYRRPPKLSMANATLA